MNKPKIVSKTIRRRETALNIQTFLHEAGGTVAQVAERLRLIQVAAQDEFGPEARVTLSSQGCYSYGEREGDEFVFTTYSPETAAERSARIAREARKAATAAATRARKQVEKEARERALLASLQAKYGQSDGTGAE